MMPGTGSLSDGQTYRLLPSLDGPRGRFTADDDRRPPRHAHTAYAYADDADITGLRHATEAEAWVAAAGCRGAGRVSGDDSQGLTRLWLLDASGELARAICHASTRHAA